MLKSGSSFYYLSWAPSRWLNKLSVSGYLRSLGCNSFNRYFWRIPAGRLSEVLSHFESENVVVLYRSRKLVRHSYCEGRTDQRLGSLIVIAYKLNNPSRKGRKIVQRALQRAPYLKLSPSVYAFPQSRRRKTIERITGGRHQTTKNRVTTPREFVGILNRLDARVLKMSRLIVVSPLMENMIVERMKSTRRSQCQRLTQSCKNTLASIRLQRGEYFSVRAHKAKLSEIKYRYRAIRAVLGFFRSEMGIDLSLEIAKASRAISSCHQALSLVEARATGAAELAH